MSDVQLIRGDCLDVLRGLEAGSVDAVVTDPPAGIAFMSRQWDAQRTRGRFVDFLAPRLAECLRVVRPGARMLCWGLPRTSHWTATAVEDAGWLIENKCYHLFGQGFPKGKGQLKPAVEEWVLARKPGGKVPDLNVGACRIGTIVETWPASRSYGTKGKKFDSYSVQEAETQSTGPAPAGRWPANLCLSHHPACRQVGTKRVKGTNTPGVASRGSRRAERENYRFPRGVTSYAGTDGLEAVAAWECHAQCPVAELDAMSGTSKSTGGQRSLGAFRNGDVYGKGNDIREPGDPGYGDTGGASRFFATFGYFPKASRRDRNLGLDGIETLIVELIHSSHAKENGSGWESEGRRVLLQVDTAASLPRVIGVFGVPSSDASAWNTFLFGSDTTDQSPTGCKCTTGTGICSTTGSKTLSWLTLSPTSGFTVDASSGTAYGSSPVGSAGSNTRSIIITSARTASLPGVGLVASGTRLRISPRGVGNFHETVKSQDLMRWLIRLICKPGGTLIDPFAGSGSTLLAAMAEDVNAIGIESDPIYYALAERRLAAARLPLGFG